MPTGSRQPVNLSLNNILNHADSLFVSSTLGNGCASLIVRRLSFLKFRHSLKLLSFLRTKTTLLEKGLFDSLIAPHSSISLRCSRTSLNIEGGIRRYGSLNGVSSVSLISCSTDVVYPRSVGPVENTDYPTSQTIFV